MDQCPRSIHFDPSPLHLTPPLGLGIHIRQTNTTIPRTHSSLPILPPRPGLITPHPTRSSPSSVGLVQLHRRGILLRPARLPGDCRAAHKSGERRRAALLRDAPCRLQEHGRAPRVGGTGRPPPGA
jgi:hypothetical protein